MENLFPDVEYVSVTELKRDFAKHLQKCGVSPPNTMARVFRYTTQYERLIACFQEQAGLDLIVTNFDEGLAAVQKHFDTYSPEDQKALQEAWQNFDRAIDAYITLLTFNLLEMRYSWVANFSGALMEGSYPAYQAAYRSTARLFAKLANESEWRKALKLGTLSNSRPLFKFP